MLTNNRIDNNDSESSENADSQSGDQQSHGEENDNQHELADEGSTASAKRTRDDSNSEQTPALKKMAHRARVLNALRESSKIFPDSGFKTTRKEGRSPVLPINDPEDVDNKLHFWKENYSAVLGEDEEPLEPTWLELYDNDRNDAYRSFSAYCFSVDCSAVLLSKAGYSPSAISDLLDQNSVAEVKRIVEDCLKQSAQRPFTSQTMVTTHVPALSKLHPHMVADFAERLLADYNIGHSYDLQQILVTHADTLTVLFKSKGFLKVSDTKQVWSRWSVPTFCENLLKVIP